MNACKSAIQMIGSIPDCDVRLCCKCGLFYDNAVDHCISECTYLHCERVKLWERINQFNPLVYMYLRGLDKFHCPLFYLEKCALILFPVLICVHSGAWSYTQSIASGLDLSCKYLPLLYIVFSTVTNIS